MDGWWMDAEMDKRTDRRKDKQVNGQEESAHEFLRPRYSEVPDASSL